MFNWKLSHDNFTFLDRLKVAKYVLGGEQLTMGPKTAEFEKKMAELAGVPYVVAASSGSTANQLIFELHKQNLKYNIKDTVVLVPSTTWISSITPAIMAGFQIEFVDINLNDFCFNYEKLEEVVAKWDKLGKKVVLFPTSLIGYNPDFRRLKHISKKYNTELWLDSCENTLSYLPNEESVLGQCRFTTTSCYFSHHFTSVEAGFVFIQNEPDYEKALMIRNHGLTRSLPKNSITKVFVEIENSSIDPQFLFELEGTNYRMSDMHAVWGLLDFERKNEYSNHRREIFNEYAIKLDRSKYYLPFKEDNQTFSVPFCLPIFIKQKNKINELKYILNKNGIETRPVIGGNLLKQPVFQNKPYILNPQRPEYYENSEWLHNHGCYVGLNQNINRQHIIKLIDILEKF